jgi:hypothetical protein
MRIFTSAILVIGMAACTPQPIPTDLPETKLPFFGDGYRANGDLCRRLGESAETINYLDHTADLVGCPETMPDLQEFKTETGAREVFRQDGYVVYSIPLGI